MDTRDLWMSRKELRHSHGILRMRAHAPRQGAHAAQDQPAIKRRGDCAALVLNAAEALEKIILYPGNNDSSENVTMAAEIFRRRVQD